MAAKYVKALAKIIEKNLDGRTQAWLAEQSGVDKSKINRLLKNDETVKLDLGEIAGFAKALHFQAPELVSKIFEEVDGKSITAKKTEGAKQSHRDRDWREAARVLHALADASPEKRHLVLYLLLKDAAYLPLLESIPVISQFLQGLKKVP